MRLVVGCLFLHGLLFPLHAAGETAVHITIVNGDLQSFKLLVGEYGADVHARARGRFFMPEDCKDKIKQETNYDGEWSRASNSSDISWLC